MTEITDDDRIHPIGSPGDQPMMGDLVDRLRGRYPVGPMLKNGEPEFGWRRFPDSPPVQLEAAEEIEKLRWQVEQAARWCGVDLSELDSAWEGRRRGG